METPTRFETTCPSCSRDFELDSNVEEAPCPHCGTVLKFLDEAPAEPVSDASTGWTPASAPWPPSTAPAPAPPPVAPPGHYNVQCPACSGAFTAAATEKSGSCPACGTSLVYEDEFANGASTTFALDCPACSQSFDVSLDAERGSCPHCSTALVFDDVWPGEDEEAPSAPTDMATAPAAAAVAAQPEPPGPYPPMPPEPYPVPPPPEPGPEPEPEPEDPDDEAKDAKASATPEPPKRGRFRRFRLKESEPEPPATEPPSGVAAAADLPPPAEPAKEGLPYILSCPTCQKEFSVSPAEREGNCPHCRAPLAFLSEKEYEALLEADERKKAFQARLQQKRRERKEREEQRLAALAARREKRLQHKTTGAGAGLEPSSLAKRLLWRRKQAPAEPTRTEAPAAPALAETAPPELAPEPPKKKGKKPAPEAAAPPPVPEPAALEVAPPAPEAAPEEPTPPKPSFWARLFRFGRKKKPETAAPATVEVETTPLIELPAEAQPTPVEPAKRGKAKKEKKPEEPPAPVAAARELSVELETPPIPVEAPQPEKRGLLSRFKRAKTAAPEAPAANVEAVSIDFGSGEDVVAAPTPKPEKKSKKAKEEKPAPALPQEPAVEFAGIDIGGPVEIEATPSSSPAPPKKGLFARFGKKPKAADAAPAAEVEVGSIDIGGDVFASSADSTGDAEKEAKPTPKAAPSKKRKK